MERVGFALYAACVDFMLRAANACGVTYRDANAAMWFSRSARVGKPRNSFLFCRRLSGSVCP